MNQTAWQKAARALSYAERAGLAQCPSCSIPLNYLRGNLPNSAVYAADGAVACSRCVDLAKVALCSATASTANFVGRVN